MSLLLVIILLTGLFSLNNSFIPEVDAKDSPHYGYSIKQPLSVYSSPQRNLNVLKQYDYNTRLKFKAFNDKWFQVTVYLNGIAYKGYIHKSDVAMERDSTSIHGIALALH